MMERRHRWIVGISCATMALASACGGPGSDSENLQNSSLGLGPMGGETTIESRSSHAFKKPAPNLDSEGARRHAAGDKAFEAQFVPEPADANPGLGPTFNNNACSKCHVRNGRGRPQIGQKGVHSHMLVRISDDTGTPAHPGAPKPVGEFGTQIQDQSIWEAEPEADIEGVTEEEERRQVERLESVRAERDDEAV
ncbi:MAG: di-heme oxidoredictase family protein, partial [Bradymonadaceae bacterium]